MPRAPVGYAIDRNCDLQAESLLPPGLLRAFKRYINNQPWAYREAGVGTPTWAVETLFQFCDGGLLGDSPCGEKMALKLYGDYEALSLPEIGMAELGAAARVFDDDGGVGGAADGGDEDVKAAGFLTDLGCGGNSFAAGTLVELASGAAISINQLKPGDKVLATNTKTGKTSPEAVSAVLVHRDTDLYDLKVKSRGRVSVIRTTSNRLFWVPGIGGHDGRWVKAGALKYGTHLRALGTRDTAIVTGGYVPQQRDGWMWDLTVTPSHDFYINTIAVAVPVHNETCTVGDVGKPGDTIVLGRQPDTAMAKSWPGHLVLDDPAWTPEGNIDWIRAAMTEGRQFYIGSPMIFQNLRDTQADRPTVFQLELNTILDPSTGYQFSDDGQYLVPGPTP